MPTSSEVFFVSSNENKYREAQKISDTLGLKLGFIQHTLEEIQSDSIVDIAKRKAADAFDKFNKSVLIEDDGLFIDALDGFPGPYSSYIYKTIGNEGILRLLSQNRQAKFVSVLSFKSKNEHKSFQAELQGSIAASPKGDSWGFDPIFIPINTSYTFAQINKNTISHRYMALKKFANWYTQESSYL